MTASAPRVDVDALRRSVSLVELLPEDAKARKVGRDTWRALCSFHAERTASMQVRLVARGWVFHCFGCHEHGDVIDYVMRTQRLAFRDALAALGGDRFAEAVMPRGYGRGRIGNLVVPCAGRGCGANVEIEKEQVSHLGVSGCSSHDYAAAGWRLDGNWEAWCPRCCWSADRARAGRPVKRRRWTHAQLEYVRAVVELRDWIVERADARRMSERAGMARQEATPTGGQ